MTLYTVHEPLDAPEEPLARAERVELIKEGFAWLALIVPVLWLIYHRMWLSLAGYLVVLVLLQVGLSLAGLAEPVIGWCMIAFSVVFAFEANDLKRWTLARRGYRMIASVTGRDRDEAELKFFQMWPEAAAPAPVPAAALREQKPARSRSGRADGDEVIGLFPQPGR